MSRKTRRRIFSKFGNRPSRNSRRFKKQVRLADSYESLEARRLLAFSFGFDGTTLTLDQTVDDGAIVIDNNGGGDAFRTTDGSGTFFFSAATSLVVNLLDGTSNTLDFDLDNAHAGDVELNLGDGTRAVNFTGSSNAIGGDLDVNSGSGDQTIEIAVNSSLTVGNNLLFDLGSGSDTVDEDSMNLVVAGNWEFTGVNLFENSGTMTVGGFVSVDVSGETEETIFDDDATMAIGGNFTFTGGDGRDEVTLNGGAGGTSIGGNALIDIGDNTVGGTQFIFLNTANSSIAGTLNVISTSATHLDHFLGNNGASFGGDVTVDLGDGPNNATFTGVFNGNTVTYWGGDDSDTVVYGMTGNPAFVNAILGAGDDTFTLNAGAAISPTTLRIDFGGGTDTFTNNYGAFDFNASFLNMDGFNRFYSNPLDQWNMIQIANLGDVVVSNNGTGNAIQLSHSYTTEMSPAATIRVKMFNDSGDIAVDLGSALLGDLLLDLHNGDRNIDFIGPSNTILGNVFVEAADGVQRVGLAVTNTLNVGGAVVINLREGIDVVDESANGINVIQSLIFRGVNNFENEGFLHVGAMLMNTSFETEKARLDNDGIMTIDNSLIYIGGNSKDDIILNDGVTVGGNASLDVGNNLDEFPAQNINLSGFHGMGSVTVIGGESFGGNSLVTDFATIMDDNFIIDFSANSSSNQAVFLGTYSDNLGFYQGGSGEDVVTMNEVAGDMDFYVKLGAGSDTFSLGGGTTLVYLFVNFGNDFDIFNDQFEGIYPFATTFWNLP